MIRAEDVFRDQRGDSARQDGLPRGEQGSHPDRALQACQRLPLIWSEFNASYKNESEVTDSAYMGPWLADTIRQCDGLVSMMSYWTFSDVFEEQGVVKTPFYGGYGLIAENGIPKPAYNAFALLHKLGDQRIALDSDSALLTRKEDGTMVLAVWNYAPPGGETGISKTVTLRFQNLHARRALIWRVDREHGDFRSVRYEKMGSPLVNGSRRQSQVQSFYDQSAELPAPEKNR